MKVLNSIEMNVNSEYEVIVFGGGPSGCAAAISAAREGAKTLLIESTYTLGGMSTNGLVSWAPMHNGEDFVYGSIALELISEAHKNITDQPMTSWLRNHYEETKLTFDRKVIESGAQVLFGSMLCAATQKDGNISSVVVSNKNGLTKYTAKVYIDCTGDADLVYFAGLDYEKSDCLQPSTLCCVMNNVKSEDMKKNSSKIRTGDRLNWLQQSIANDPEFDLIDDAHLCVDRNLENSVNFNAGHIFDVDGTNPEQVTKAMMKGREMSLQLRDAMKKYLPEVFASAAVIQTASVLGIRESRRAICDYTLTLEDYLERRTFADEIGRNCYYVDVHASQEEMKKYGKDTLYKNIYQYEKGESHGIPLRSLIVKGVNNLLVAGRAISSDHLMMASIRIMPCCMVTGEAAGLTAALASKQNSGIREVDSNDVRAVLFERGAFIK